MNLTINKKTKTYSRQDRKPRYYLCLASVVIIIYLLLFF